MAKSVAQDLRNGVRESEASAAQNPAQQPSESGRMGPQQEKENPGFAGVCDTVQTAMWRRRESNPRPATFPCMLLRA